MRLGPHYRRARGDVISRRKTLRRFRPRTVARIFFLMDDHMEFTTWHQRSCSQLDLSHLKKKTMLRVSSRKREGCCVFQLPPWKSFEAIVSHRLALRLCPFEHSQSEGDLIGFFILLMWRSSLEWIFYTISIRLLVVFHCLLAVVEVITQVAYRIRSGRIKLCTLYTVLDIP